MTSLEPFAGCVLAGGLSSRMGTDKALLLYQGKRLVDHMVVLLQHAGAKPVFVSGVVPEVLCVPDGFVHTGPMGGIATILQTQPDVRAWLFVPVDMPCLTSSLLNRLTTQSFDAVCAEESPLPLFLRRTRAVEARLEDVLTCLRAGKSLSVKEFLSGLKVSTIHLDSDEKALWINTNTSQEWEALLASLSPAVHIKKAKR